MKKQVLSLIILIGHLVALSIVTAAFFNIAKWYYNSSPIWGVDFFYTASLANLLKQTFVLPPLGWGYAWFGGWPLLSNYPILHLYFIVPLISYFGLLSAVKIWMLVALILFFAGLYAVYYLLSKNIILSVLLAICAVYSVSIYGALMWGGSLPSHASQAFYPWAVFFALYYLKNKSTRALLTSAVVTGLAILGHPQIPIAYIYPTIFILFTTSWGSINIKQRAVSFVLYFVVSILIGIPLLYSTFGGALSTLVVTNSTEVATTTARVNSKEAQDIQAFHRKQPLRIFQDNNKVFFLIAGTSAVLFVAGLFFAKSKREKILLVLPFIVLSIYYTFYIWIFAFGISMYHGGWYRLFWSVPLWLGMLGASLWGEFQDIILQRTSQSNVGRYFKPIVICVLGILILIPSVAVFFGTTGQIKEEIVARNNSSSAFPNAINLHPNDEQFKLLKKEIAPSWIDTDNTNYRIYSGDQRVNIWWNSLNRMPLARGYLDPPFKNRGYLFWLDASLSQDPVTGKDQLEGSFHLPGELALNNSLFLIDWYSAKYLEESMRSDGGGKIAFAPFPNSLIKDENIMHQEQLNFILPDGVQIMQYYEIKDSLVSPILSGTDAPTIGIFASDSGYETVIRALADARLTSKHIIPIKLGKTLDAYSLADLSVMDGLLLYDYRYESKNRAFSMLQNYLEGGKHIFIDTGVENPESKTSNLPAIFPIEETTRTFLNDTWNFETIDTPLLAGVDLNQFSPPQLDSAGWNFSYPKNPNQVRNGANILIKDQGYPLMVSKTVGRGEVIWSGFNLPYHISRYHNRDEAVFFYNILNSMVGSSEEKNLPNSSVTFANSVNRSITVDKAKGILFKEHAFPGWQAWATASGYHANLRIWRAGPSEEGFMYVHLPEKSKISVNFTYHGSSQSWIFFDISVVTFIVVTEEAVLHGILLGRIRRKFTLHLSKRLKLWWAKEDEE